jgi:hypothetical protein
MGHIIWIHGPVPCGDWPDINIFKHALQHILLDGEPVECNDGYKGDDPQLVKTPGGIRFRETANANKIQDVARARHETANHLLEHFKVLSGTFLAQSGQTRNLRSCLCCTHSNVTGHAKQAAFFG